MQICFATAVVSCKSLRKFFFFNGFCIAKIVSFVKKKKQQQQLIS